MERARAALVPPAEARELAAWLTDARERTLALVADLEGEAWLGPRLAIVNPPLWELGHVGWFEEFWIARNSQRHRGPRAQLEAARAAPRLHDADALYNSSTVAHTKRWHLMLPDARRTQAYLAHVRQHTLALLQATTDSDDALYFFRWALMHEAMHNEAALMIAQGLGWSVTPPGAANPPPRRELRVSGRTLQVGTDEGGFSFDNELGEQQIDVADFTIDNTVLTWREFLPFIEAGGYTDASHWSADGWAWRQRALPQGLPRHVVSDDSCEHGLKRISFGRWQPLDPATPALHLSAHEAQAWCRWAGRRLPTEHEWTLAQQQLGADFDFGAVWEWTASPFAPWPGFTAHPYRDYSAPWFDGRPVLKGGSFATPAALKHPRFRNYFPAGRNDVFAGFRSCAA